MSEREKALLRIMQRDTGKVPKSGEELLEQFILDELTDLNKRLTTLRKEKETLENQLARVRAEGRRSRRYFRWGRWWTRKY